MEQFNGRVLNASEMGLGKTYETLMALSRNQSTWLPALIVTPASVKINWQYEASKYWGLDSYVCETRTPPKYSPFNLAIHSPITLINYDILHDWIPYLKNIGFRTLVCDECQQIQNERTIRAKAVDVVASWVQQIMMLSGTPMSNRPRELYNILRILWPHRFPSFFEYARAFCDPQLTRWGWQYNGAENLDVLHGMLTELGMIRRRLADVQQHMPKLTRRIVPCEMTNPQEYNDANVDFISWLRRNASHRVKSAERAPALTKIGMLLLITARQKLRAPVEWASKFLEETDEKLGLFAINRAATDVLQRRIGVKSVTINGDMSSTARHDAVMQFQHDPDTRLLIGTRAAWTGINATAASNGGVLQFFWRPGDHLQLEGRLNRIGQTKPVTMHYFVAVGTIEERLCELLQDKQEVISSVLDGGKTPEDLNIFSLLLDELEQGV